MKPDPVTVSVNAGPLPAITGGEMPLMTGAGAMAVTETADEVPEAGLYVEEPLESGE